MPILYCASRIGEIYFINSWLPLSIDVWYVPQTRFTYWNMRTYWRWSAYADVKYAVILKRFTMNESVDLYCYARIGFE